MAGIPKYKPITQEQAQEAIDYLVIGAVSFHGFTKRDFDPQPKREESQESYQLRANLLQKIGAIKWNRRCTIVYGEPDPSKKQLGPGYDLPDVVRKSAGLPEKKHSGQVAPSYT